MAEDHGVHVKRRMSTRGHLLGVGRPTAAGAPSAGAHLLSRRRPQVHPAVVGAFAPSETRQDIETLEALAASMGIEVVRDSLEEIRGGLCRIYDRYVLYVDVEANAKAQVETLCQALARFDTDNCFLLPRLRERISAYAEQRERV